MKLLVHIGANKTGSSAVQVFLGENAAELKSEGMVVPDGSLRLGNKLVGNHVQAFYDILNNSNGQERFEQLMAQLISKTKDASTIILSAENLAENRKAPDLFASLVQKFPVHVIFYIRRQDEYLLSAWQQWRSKVLDDFWAWAVSAAGNIGNWRRVLENWERVIPREHISVRVFDRTKLNGGDVVEDFCEQIGVARPFDAYSRSTALVNPSFSDAIMDMVKGNNLIFDDIHDNEFHRFVQEMTGDRYIKKSRQSSITLAQRQAIFGKYLEINRWVADNYFSGGEEQLFSPIRPEDFEYVPLETQEREKLEFLTSVIYRLYKEFSSQRNSGGR